MSRDFNKKIKPRDLHGGDLVLKEIRASIQDLRGIFMPN